MKLVSSTQQFYERMHGQITSGTDVFYRHYGDVKYYGDLAQNIFRLNSLLKDLEAARIAIFAEKGFENYCCIFATLLSGNIWVPMSPAIPDSRNAEMLRIAKPNLILTDRALPELMQSAADKIGSDVQSIGSWLNLVGGETIGVPQVADDDLAIIYFTSGSTGAPKGVKITHQNYIINVENILRLVEIGVNEVFADYHDLGFVISVPVLFSCIMSGSALAPGISQNDQFLPIRNMNENSVTILITVPSTIARIRKGQRSADVMGGLNVLICCGEPMHIDILDYGFDGLAAKQIYNFYGSTEVAPWIFYHRCLPKDRTRFRGHGVVPVGNPIEGNEVRFTEEDELWVSGLQVTPGYLGREDVDRFQILDEKRWYRTGDKLIRYEDVYLCKGRLDSQVKIGGYRIELMEVESQLRKLDGVESSLCFITGEGVEKLIVAVLISQKNYDTITVRNHLKEWLPGYMLPRRVHCLTTSPLNKSGKIDRAGIIAKYS